MPEKNSRNIFSYSTFLKNNKRKIIALLISVAVLFSFTYLYVIKAPSEFPTKTTFTISEGLTLTEIAESFEEEKIIKSSFWLKNIVAILGGEKGVFAGDYYFNKKSNVFSIAWRISKGIFDLTPVKITIPEGATNKDISLIISSKLKNFNDEEFLLLVEGKEGYLFPDTYFFLPNVKPKSVIQTLEQNFSNRIGEIRADIIRFGESLEDVVIMASLLEKEARTVVTRRTIAGILWTRIEIGMPLQVDAVFEYINGKNTFELTLDDLTIDSPYNTYVYKGLPVGPIANPGLESMRDAINPIPSEYLFYLSDSDGNMHYSETFEGHKQNKSRYLD